MQDHTYLNWYIMLFYCDSKLFLSVRFVSLGTEYLQLTSSLVIDRKAPNVRQWGGVTYMGGDS